MINCLLMILLFVISVLLADHFLIEWKADKYKKKNIRSSKTNEDFFKHFISKINFIKTKEKDHHTNVHNKRICKDGPVFLSTEVEI